MTRHTTNPHGNFRDRSSPLSVSDKVSLITDRHIVEAEIKNKAELSPVDNLIDPWG